MPKRTCAFCAKRSGLAMRTGMVANLAAGVCCIAFACSVQFPIQTLAAVGMLLMGILSVVSTISGLIGSWHYRICLTVYLYMGGLSTFGQMILVICMHTNFNGVLDNLDTHSDDEKYSRASVAKVGFKAPRSPACHLAGPARLAPPGAPGSSAPAARAGPAKPAKPTKQLLQLPAARSPMPPPAGAGHRQVGAAGAPAHRDLHPRAGCAAQVLHPRRRAGRLRQL
jgi:hypothetical protein